jgi:hypothetical protein
MYSIYENKKTQNSTLWTEELTVARNRVNAFRRKYQRTKTTATYVANTKPNIT